MKGYLAILLLVCSLAAPAPAEAHPPYGLVADPAGNVYFSDLETVWRFSPSGRLTVFRPKLPERHVHVVALAPDGAILGDQNRYIPATERFYSGLWRRTPDGVERPIVPMTERPPPGAGVWQDSAGNLYTSQWFSSADRRMVLLRRRPNGQVEVLFDEAGGALRPPQPTVESIGGMAFGPDGSLFFTNGSVLRRLAPNGTVTTLFMGGVKSSFRGLAAKSDGSVLAADSGMKTVLAVAPDGKATTLYQETAAWSPTAVAMAGNRLLVLEANDDAYRHEDRVRLIEVKDGRGRVVASPAHPQNAEAPPPSRTEQPRPSNVMILLASVAAAAAVFTVFRFLWLRSSDA